MRLAGEIDSGAAPHIVIVDMSTSAPLGMSMLEKVRSRDMTAGIVILTSSRDERCIRKLIEAGASAVLSLDISVAGLIDTIRAVAAGQMRIDPELLARLYFDLTPRLSEREVEVLACVAQGHTNSKIGVLLGIAVETVKTHLKNLLNKLGASNRTEAVTIAMKRGLLEL